MARNFVTAKQKSLGGQAKNFIFNLSTHQTHTHASFATYYEQ